MIAAHGGLSTDPLLYLGTLGGVALTWGTLYIRVIYPRSQAHKQHEAERAAMRQQLDDKDNARNQVIDGIPAVPGMTEGVPPIAVRVQELEAWRREQEAASGA